jgi:MraZ protein
MDRKGRISLPAKHYKILLDDLAIIHGPDRKYPCLWVYKADEFSAWARDFLEGEGGFDKRSASQNALRRRLFGNRVDVSVDAAQRILIPKNQREYASLEGSVVIIGVDDHLELWNPDIHAQSEAFYDEYEFIDHP